MVRWLKTVVFVYLCANTFGQPLTSGETVRTYSNAQKRLLVRSTAKFINAITQNNLDKDSVMLISRSVTGLPFLVAYSEDHDAGSSSVGTDLINSGGIPQAIQLLSGLKGETRMYLLIKLAKWFLYKPGRHKADLDSANFYIQGAMTESSTAGNINGRYECLGLLGEYYHQNGDEEESKKIFLQMVSSSQQEEERRITADTWNLMGQLQSDNDSLGLVYLNKSIVLYQQLQLKEKEIEVLWEIAGYHLASDLALLRDDLVRILAIQQEIGFQHSLFAEHLLSFVSVIQSKNLEALEHANTAIENMKWSGLSLLEGTFCTRVGVAYEALGKSEEALTWYKEGIEHRSKNSQMFWFKSFLYATTHLVDHGRLAEALTLIDSVILKFPPITSWETAQVLTLEGVCYQKLGNYKLADEHYRAFFQLTQKHPDLDRYGEFTDGYLEIIKFYLSLSNVKAARLFMKKAFSSEVSMHTEAKKAFILFKIDSIEGNYKSAIGHHIQFKFFDDLDKSMEQRKKFDELEIKYGAEKKDQEIQMQATKLQQAMYTRNWILGAVALLLIVVGLLVYNTRLKQRTHKQLESQRAEIEKQNSTLRHLVDEKDWLVKEIHHRVKNNLQIVMSLLNSQSAYADNDAALTAIHNSQHRVHAMSLIHQKLYNSENVSSIDMSSYIRELTLYLSDSFNTRQRIRFEFAIEPLELDVSQAVPIGLILNEAITNSIKYAFPDGRSGVITIALSNSTSNQYVLSISDNGVGMPTRLDSKQSGSLGMSLIAGLSEDLEGEFSIESNRGTTIRVSFKQTAVVSRREAENVY
jgi:two-component system, sensor histidine kinase PdtaS